MEVKRAIVLVLDGVGCGEAPDAPPLDRGTNSLLKASKIQKIDAPALQSLGLEHISSLIGLNVVAQWTRNNVLGAFGRMKPTFEGNGSNEGHQAMMGHVVREAYRTFDVERIPPEIDQLLIQAAETVTGRKVEIIKHPDTDDISGTVFIEHASIGPHHLESRDPEKPLWIPRYASSDSLVQIALHNEVLTHEQMVAIGKEFRKLLNEHKEEIGRIARVILRPFEGEPGKFKRISEGRVDFGVDPEGPTLIDALTLKGIPVHSIGKFSSMFNNRGFPEELDHKLKTDEERIQALLEWVRSQAQGLMCCNLVGFDELYGHRRDAKGYVHHLNAMDITLFRIFDALQKGDILFITSDHGNDPTGKGTNHTREWTPLMVASQDIQSPIDLGDRESFADLGKTLAEIFGIPPESVPEGTSFLQQLAS